MGYFTWKVINLTYIITEINVFHLIMNNIFFLCRLGKLEKKVFVENGEMPPLVQDLQNKVEHFKEKLQVLQSIH